MKAEYTSKLNKLETQLSEDNEDDVSVDGILSVGIKNLLRLGNLYKQGDIAEKRNIVGSMYPEK